MMLGAKAPNYDTYGLFRALHSHNPTQYSHIVKHTLHFYAHIWAGPKVIHPGALNMEMTIEIKEGGKMESTFSILRRGIKRRHRMEN